MRGLAILLACALAGVVLHDYARVPLPGNVIGLLLLFAGLLSGFVKLHWVEETSRILLRHMMVLFAPVIVGTLALVDLLAANWVSLVGTVVISTVVTLLVTAGIGRMFSNRDEGSRGERGGDEGAG